jgi:hypothetical protein
MIMKRMILLAMCFLLICTCAVTVSAEDSSIYDTARQLYEAWVSQGCVPDYISGVWSTDGGTENLTFGVVKGEAGEKGRLEILTLIRDDSTVTIVYQTYSRNYLYRIQEEVVDAYFKKELGLVTAGVDEYHNKLYFEVHTDYANNADTLAMIQLVTEQYGDAVSFRYTDTYPQFVMGTQPPVQTGPMLMVTHPQNQVFPYGFVFGSCGIVLALLFFFELRRRRVMAVAAEGKPVVVDAPPISEKEVEDAIRKAECKTSAALDDRIMRSIKFDAKE